MNVQGFIKWVLISFSLPVERDVLAEPLASAAERVNRYARQQIEVDPSVATVGISGVFNAGDADAFIEAVTAYFPVQVDQTKGAEIHLTARK